MLDADKHTVRSQCLNFISRLESLLWDHLNSAWKPCLIIHYEGRQYLSITFKENVEAFSSAKQQRT